MTTQIDGRKTIQPPTTLQATPIRESSRRLLVNLFLTTRRSAHSGFHKTLAYIVDYCEKNKIPYKLTAVPTQGYLIERISTAEYFNPTYYGGNISERKTR